MPKTKEEKETLEAFHREYKDPEKAKRIYYSLRNKNKKFDESQGGGFSSKKAEAQWWVERLEKLPIASAKSRVLQRLRLKDPELDWWINRIQAITKANKKSQSGISYPLPVNASGIKGDKDKKDKKKD